MTDDASAPGGKPRDPAEDAPTAGRTARDDPASPRRASRDDPTSASRTTRDDPTSASRAGRTAPDDPTSASRTTRDDPTSASRAGRIAPDDPTSASRTTRDDPASASRAGRTTTQDDPTGASQAGRLNADAPDPAGSAGQPGAAQQPGTPGRQPGSGRRSGIFGRQRPGDPAGQPGAGERARRRRRLLIGGIAGALLLILVLGCAAVVAVLRSGSRLVDQADEREDRSARARQACVELETRLNRLVPPGATGGDPRRRATAIRAENAAVRPFLADIEQPVGNGDRRRHGRPADVAAWQQLVDARVQFADALDRQATGGEPAFFIAPRSPRGAQVAELLERSAPATCTGAVRRLAHPDL